MRRPPDTLPPTSNEVASSNSTLNAFLGGKQKSWMTGASNVRPTPRDPTRTSISTTSAASLQRNSAATVLPSPAPSDEPSPVQPRTESPAAEVQSVEVQIEPMYQTPQPPLQPQPQPQQHPPQQQQSPPQQQLQVISPGAPPPNFYNTHRPPAQENQNPNGGQPAPQVHHHHHNKRKRTMASNSGQANSSPSLSSRVTMIDEHIRKTGFNNLNQTIERPRFSLLREACTMDDFFYVALHQIFCMWTINQSGVFTIPDLPDQETLSLSFKILSQLIRDNSGLNVAHLNWFTNFPASLPNLLASSDVYRKNLTNVGVFLLRLKTDWNILTIKCQERCYPPLCDELVSVLNLLSPVLQNVFFTATRRNLNIQDDKYGHAMEALFVKDRSEFRSLAARMNTDDPPTEKEMDIRKNKLINDYLKLNKQRVQDEQIARPLQPAPRPGPAPKVVVPHQASRSNSYTQAPQAQYARQDSAQQIQPQSRYTASPYSPHQSHAMHPLDTRMQQQHYDPNASPQMAAGYAPNVSAGYGYMPTASGVSSNMPSPGARQFLPGYHPGPQQSFPVQEQSPHGSAAPQALQQPQHPPQQQQGPWAREFIQPHEQDQRIRQILQQQQINNQQQQDQCDQMQQQHPMPQQHPRQTQLRGGNAANPSSRHGSRQNSTGNTNAQNINPAAYMPVLGSNHNGTAVRRRAETSLIPPSNAVVNHSNLPPQPDLTALHQAHVRSPRLLTSGLLNSKVPKTPDERFYQSIKDFVIPPTRLSTEMSLSSYQFEMTDATFTKVARTLWHPGELATRNVSNGSLQFRFRCVQIGRENRVPTENEWITTETRWPEALFVEVNANQLELRRKCLHGRDLATDITTFVEPSGQGKGKDGANIVAISYPRNKVPNQPTYAFAVEVVEVLQHRTIINMVLKSQRIPETETLNNIMSKLSMTIDDDDEIAMVASDLTIDLADPFTARIFETPVRGATCLHRECFDLETFLTTRNTKPRRPEQPTMVDVWKCPLCGRDARPYSLRVDDFLLSVRNSLGNQNLLDTKAILVSADGTWRPKPEPQPTNRGKRNASAAGMDEDYSDDENDHESRKSAAPSNAPPPEIIDLDSD